MIMNKIPPEARRSARRKADLIYKLPPGVVWAMIDNTTKNAFRELKIPETNGVNHAVVCYTKYAFRLKRMEQVTDKSYLFYPPKVYLLDWPVSDYRFSEFPDIPIGGITPKDSFTFFGYRVRVWKKHREKYIAEIGLGDEIYYHHATQIRVTNWPEWREITAENRRRFRLLDDYFLFSPRNKFSGVPPRKTPRDPSSVRDFKDPIRTRILIRDNYRCVICGKPQEEGSPLDIDHILPYSQGGKTTFENGRTLCHKCNMVVFNTEQRVG